MAVSAQNSEFLRRFGSGGALQVGRGQHPSKVVQGNEVSWLQGHVEFTIKEFASVEG